MSTKSVITQKFEALLRDADDVMRRSGWDGRSYQQHPGSIDYRRIRTEALNLVRRVCGEASDHHKELNRLAEDQHSATNPYYLKDCLGVLQAAKRDFEQGMLFDLRALIAAELLGDFLEQADALLQAGYHVPAASLAGAILEDALRKLCSSRGIAVPERTTIDRLNAELAKGDVYNKLIQKRVTMLADIRNNADHGRFDQFKKEDVEDMVGWVRKFCADHLA